MNERIIVQGAPVPPPVKAPLYARATRLGLLPFFRVDERNSPFKCGNCHTFQPGPTNLVWVPDTVLVGDPAWVIEEACRENARNGHHSGWCVLCAARLGVVSPKVEAMLLESTDRFQIAVVAEDRKSLVARIIAWFR
jgi:hypothetical protein